MFYFDHNATTPVAPEVLDVYTEALRSVPGNASSSHLAGQDARRHLEQARAVVARSLNATAQEIVFTSGGTESNNLAIFGVARNAPGARRHVIATAIEHPSVLEAIRQLGREGIDVTIAAPSVTGIAAALRDETVLVSAMHANNETGEILPVREIAKLVRARREVGQAIYFHSDGVQALGKIGIDVAELDVDLYSVSAHKFYGPKGVGALFVRKNTALSGIQFGGRHERARRAGTENVAGAMAFARACELFGKHTDFVKMLRDQIEERLLNELDGIEVNGRQVERLPNTSNIMFRGLSGEAMLIALDSAGFAVSTGSACSSGSIEPSHVLLAMGRSVAEARSSVRFSFGNGNSAEDVDRLVDAVVGIVNRMRKNRERRSSLVAH